MQLSRNFAHQEAEKKWYAHWLQKGHFKSEPDQREPYTIVMPPPNVTGVLHMGHCLNNTIQDILIRRARMQGKNACWVPGTDHASIATEARVVAMLREMGITKSSLTRDEFVGYAWQWTEKYGGIILQQLRMLGCSADWDRTTFTMDKHFYKSVIEVFIGLYKKGNIYRGKRMINWDVKAKTALSDEEVIRKETSQFLYYIRYPLVDADGKSFNNEEGITIATVRPETIMGDSAISVHPDDGRYKHLHGKFALVPLIGRRIPIITDEYVTMDFGTGALKITPAHDMNDNMLGQKHGLEVIDIFNDDGTLNEAAQIFVGEERFAARKKIVAELEEKRFLVRTESYTSEVGYSERTDTVVEPRLSMQWWVAMKGLSTPAITAVMGEEIKFYPPKFKNTYRNWMENIKDWCISRQLWWGHRIPAWYDENGNVYVAANEEDARRQWKEKNAGGNVENVILKQDEDCLDTWFSAWLWPFEVFKGFSQPGNADIKYYYPTSTLVTAPEIIFFWVARMIMAGLEYMHEKPFNDVYFTGIVRDKQGRKMSKSLGNSPDLMALIHQYGADAVRFGIMVSSPAGNDLMFDESSLEQGRNFNNKMWNALKLIKMWEEKISDSSTPVNNDSFAIQWFTNRLNEVKAQVETLMRQFRLSEVLKTIYSLVWDDFCSWYLEWIKPGFEQPLDRTAYNKTVSFFEELLQLIHPFTPFVSEEIHHLLRPQPADLCVTQLHPASVADPVTLQQGERLKQVISALRDARNKNRVKPKDTIQLYIQTLDSSSFEAIQNIIAKQVNGVVSYTREKVNNTIVVTIEKDTFYIGSEQSLDADTLKNDLLKDLEHQQNFLASVQKKLGNERFVQNARAEILEMEQKKMADATARIKTIMDGLAGLN